MTTINAPITAHPGIPNTIGQRGLAGTVGAAALSAAGVLQANGLHWDKQMHVTSVAQHIEMGLVAAGMIATLPLLLAIGRQAGRRARTATLAVAVGQVMIAVITTQSNIVGHDGSAFNALAGLGMLLWAPGLLVTAVAAVRSKTLSKQTAAALVMTFIATIPLATLGGGILAAAGWIFIARTAVRPRSI